MSISSPRLEILELQSIVNMFEVSALIEAFSTRDVAEALRLVQVQRGNIREAVPEGTLSGGQARDLDQILDSIENDLGASRSPSADTGSFDGALFGITVARLYSPEERKRFLKG